MASAPLLGALTFCPVLVEFGLYLRKCGSQQTLTSAGELLSYTID